MSHDNHDPPTTDVLDALNDELEATRQALMEAQGELAASERRHDIDALLHSANTIDINTARLLVEVELESDESDAGLDPAHVIEQLRQDKPWLFTRPKSAPRSTATPHHDPSPSEQLNHAATAARTGDRGALLRYLRLRRDARN